MSHTKINTRVLEKKVGDLKDMYNTLSKVYYMPKFGARGVNKEYLWALATDLNVWAPPHTCAKYDYYYQGRGAQELLDILAKDLLSKENKKLGFKEGDVPNIEWIKTSILHLHKGEDKYGLLSKSTKDFRYTDIEREVFMGQKDVSMKPEYLFV